MSRGWYVTGTDTGIGKSVASATLLHALRLRGLRAVGMKPLASGCERTPDGWRNEDAIFPDGEDMTPRKTSGFVVTSLAVTF